MTYSGTAAVVRAPMRVVHAKPGGKFHRFRVATRASGVRRYVYVHVYPEQFDMATAHERDRGRDYLPDRDDIAGGVTSRSSMRDGGWRWPAPDPGPVFTMRLWEGQLTTRTVAHEALHAASMIALMDVMPGWDSRARGMLMGNEPLAYLVGDITAEVIVGLYALGYFKN